MKLSAVGAHVGCTTNTSWRRTFSSISTCTSPSEKRPTIALPIGTLSSVHIELASARFALPVKTSRPAPFTLVFTRSPRHADTNAIDQETCFWTP